jgi:aminopeptidase-like protein
MDAAQTIPQPSAEGAALHAFAAELYPICRSITGNGVRRSLQMIGSRIPLKLTEVPSGSPVFDWEVPLEWNIDGAWIDDPDGRRIVDFREHNLHIVSYSEPVDAVLSLDALQSRLYSLPQYPDRIPYRTSYYRRHWGFCLRHRDLERLSPGRYGVHVDSVLAPGSLTYAECLLPGRGKDEVLFFTHTCHPSLANDNTSGMVVATALASWIATAPRRYSYRFVFAPGTIGSLCWLKRNERQLGRVRHGLVLGLLGDAAPLTYKCSRRGDCEIDRVAPYVLRGLDRPGKAIPFEPYGYDERQLCSPGFDLPVGRLTRSVNGGYPEYHTSADDLSLISPMSLESSLDACKRIVTVLEHNRRYVNLSPKGEPRLGKRDLYGSVGGHSPADRERALLWVLNQSDGGPSLLDIAERSGMGFADIHAAAEALAQADLLRPYDGRSRSPRHANARDGTRSYTLDGKLDKKMSKRGDGRSGARGR